MQETKELIWKHFSQHSWRVSRAVGVCMVGSGEQISKFDDLEKTHYKNVLRGSLNMVYYQKGYALYSLGKIDHQIKCRKEGYHEA